MQDSLRFPPDPFVMEGFYATPPVIDVDAWREYLSRKFGPTDAIGEGGPPTFFAFTEHRFDYEDRSGVPAQAFLATSKDSPDLSAYETALQQSWDFPDIKDTYCPGAVTPCPPSNSWPAPWPSRTDCGCSAPSPRPWWNSPTPSRCIPARPTLSSNLGTGWRFNTRTTPTTVSSTCGCSGSATATTIP